MNNEIKQILEAVSAGNMSVDEALLKVKRAPFEDIGYAKVDLHRKIRQGAAEVIYGAGKTPEQICGIVQVMRDNGQDSILITRMSRRRHRLWLLFIPWSITRRPGWAYWERCRSPAVWARLWWLPGGTSDVPVAEEAALTAQVLGNEVVRLYDVGVAGLHRTLAHLDEIMTASVIIAIAGMEGALASVIGGLADCPVIAVPTSVGYGASFHGLSALLSMLNPAPAVCLWSTSDNGFGAGYLASMINHMDGKRSAEG